MSLESSLKKTQSYRCDRCRDMTFVIFHDETIVCDCREIRICEDIGSRLIDMSKDYLVQMKGRKLNFRIYG